MLVDKLRWIVLPIDAFEEGPRQIALWYLHVQYILTTVFGVEFGESRKYFNGEDLWQALARTLVVDRNGIIFDYHCDSSRAAKDPSSKPTSLHEAFPQWRRAAIASLDDSSGHATDWNDMGSLMALASRQAADPSTSQPPVILATHENLEYQLRVRQFCQDRCFFVTMKGYMGLGPKGMEPGDMLAVLAGSSTPMYYGLNPMISAWWVRASSRFEERDIVYCRMEL